MTRFNPTLRVDRLVVERNGKDVFDQRFHGGVNIIRGDNSSGKSTVLNLLYYGIGGDVTDWSPVALQCTRVLAEVSLNGRAATFAREIADRGRQPMLIYAGDLDDSRQAPLELWSKYPYQRTSEKESFSQAIFRLLEIPEASNDASGNVTVHQLLRLMYGDQLSPLGTIFKYEQFDPPLLRQTVGELVFGAFENERYANQLRLRDLMSQFNEAASDLRSVSSALGRVQQVPNANWLEAEKAKLQHAREELSRRIDEAEQAQFEGEGADQLSLAASTAAYEEVQRLQRELNEARSKVESVRLDAEDAALFVRDLEAKLAALQDASAASSAFGAISFHHCPSCYSPLQEEQPVHACHLCKAPFDGERARSRIVRLITETDRQLRQSRLVAEGRQAEIRAREEQVTKLSNEWLRAARELEAVQRRPSTEAAAVLRDLQRQAGYLDREIEELVDKERLLEVLRELGERKAQLQAEITRLEAANDLIARSREDRLRTASAEVQRAILDLLKGDLPREETFIKARAVQFDFFKNALSVDGEAYFSASSRVILRNSFFVGLLVAATQDRLFRHLRFCLLDSIEDKGMEQERSHNYQRMIVAASKSAPIEHQIILGTSMIAPDLNRPEFTVGNHYTREHRTLAIAVSETE